MKKIIVAIIMLILLSGSTKVHRGKYLIVIHDGKNKTEVIRTDEIVTVDSIFMSRFKLVPKLIPESLLKESMFFEVRTENLTFYCEIK